MNAGPRQAHHAGDRRPGGRAAAASLLVATGLIAMLPLGYAFARIAHGAWTRGVQTVPVEERSLSGLDLGLLARTLGVALLIGLLATICAWPGAWWIRRKGNGSTLALLCVPLLLPATLTYAAYGLLRAPGTWLGNLAERAGSSGWPELPLFIGRAIAVGGLALWAMPLALLPLAHAVTRLDTNVLENLELDATSRMRRHAARLRLCLPALGVSIGLVALVMIGSPVPLHLAQVDTYATRVWLALDRMPEAQQWAAWLASWPVVACALAGAWLASGLVTDAGVAGTATPQAAPSARESRRHWRAAVPALLVWSLATLVPLALLAWSVRDAHSYANVVRVNTDAAARSLWVALGTGLVLALVGTLVFAAASGGSRSRSIARLCVRVLALAGLCPGVLVGSWIGGAWNTLAPALTDTPLIVVLAHAARFSFIAGVIGLRLALAEPAEERDARSIDSDGDAWSWWMLLGRRAWPTLASLAGVGAILSINEIEASIMVVPPGFDTLARRLLDYLHFARMEELSAISVLICGTGTVLAIVGTLRLRIRAD